MNEKQKLANRKKLSFSLLMLFIGIFLFIEPTYSLNINTCQTLNTAGTTYVLTANVDSGSQFLDTCFTIGANNIILDGAGYQVTYSDWELAGYGVDNTAGYDNITIKNAKFVGGATITLGTGIYFTNSQNSSIQNNTITTTTTSSSGIYLSSESSDNSNTNITNNTITTSAASGIIINAANRSLISNNTVLMNSNYNAIIMGGASANSTISNNNVTASASYGYGIALSGQSRLINITGNNITVYGGNNYGIYVTNSNYTFISQNTVRAVGAVGAGSNSIFFSTDVYFSNVTGNNLNASSGATVLITTRSDKNVVTNNKLVNGGGYYNVLVQLYSDNNTIVNNNITSLGASDIAVGIRHGSTLNNISLNNITAYVGGDGIFINNLSDSNTVFGNNITTFGTSGYGIQTNNSDSNIIDNNDVTTYGYNGYGLFISIFSQSNIFSNNIVDVRNFSDCALCARDSWANNITGGSIIARGGGPDYFLNNATRTNFTDTNFTASRKIWFYTATSWFNYRNDSSGNIWLNTGASAVSNITRTLVTWSQAQMIWNDTNTTGTGIIAFYNLSGLQVSTQYNIYNTSRGVQTNPYNLTTDSDGDLSFNISLRDYTKINVTSTTVGGDSTPPAITVQFPANNTNYSRTSMDFNLTLSETGSWAGYSLDGAANQSLTNSTGKWWFTNTSMAQGLHSAVFYANDTAGNMNVSKPNITFRVDTIAPVVTIDKPANNAIFNYPPYLNGTVSEINLHTIKTNSSYYNALDTASPFNFTNASAILDGTYTINISANDSAGNVGWANITFTLDMTIPSINFTGQTDANGSTVSRNWTFVNVSVNDSGSPNNITAFINWNNSLVGWWRFNREAGENDTLARDWSGYGNNGTIYNTNPGIDNCTGNCSGWTSSGKFGYGMKFDGKDDYVNVSDASSLNLSKAATIELWMYWNTSVEKDNKYPISKLSGDWSKRIYMYLSNVTYSYGVHFGTYNGTSFEENNFYPSASERDNWMHIVWVYDKDAGSNNMKLYSNSILRNQQTYTRAIPSIVNSLIFGNTFDSGGGFTGKLDEVRIYSRALSEEEINASYNTGIYRLYHNFTNLADGTYNYTAYAQDLAGNVNQTETRTLTVDTVLPVITLHVPATNGTYYSYVPYFNGTCTDTNLDTIRSNITQYNTSRTSPFNLTNTTPLSSQRYDVNLTCNDTAGNQRSVIFWFVYDSVQPNIAFVSPTSANNTYANNNNTYINVTVSDTLSPGNLTSFIDFNRSLVGWWRFNREAGENDTLARDWSGYGNNGTINNTNPGINNCTGNCSGWTTSGKFGYGMKFDGVNDHIKVANEANFDFERTDSFSVSAWLKPNSSFTGIQEYISKSSDTALRGWETFTNVGNTPGTPDPGKIGMMIVSTWSTNAIFVYSTNDVNINDGSWHHYVMTYNGSSTAAGIKIYEDGISIPLSIVYDSLSATILNDLPVTLGSRVDGGPTYKELFHGTMDEVLIYKRALSPEEINASYNAGIYRLYHNFTNLTYGTYTYIAYAQDLAGNVNQTETRTLTVGGDATPPFIGFVSPTPNDGNTTSNNWTYINTSVSDSGSPNNITAFINWNNNLVGWWRFNRETGENDTFARDWSGYGNNGTIYNTNPGIDNCTGNCSGWTSSGKFGNALRFDGVNDFVQASDSPSLSVMNELSVDLWVKFNALTQSGATRTVLSKQHDGTGGSWYAIHLYMEGTTNIVYFQVENTTYTPKWASFFTAASGDLGVWQHLVGTYNGSSMRVYRNGVYITSTDHKGALLDSVNPLTIGAYSVNQANCNCTIDEVRIYSRALSEEEINASYNTGIYRLYHNFTNLVDGTYNYTAYAQDLAGNVNQTETRTLTVSQSISISACQVLNTANAVYSLVANVNAGGTCFTIGANNVTLDGAGFQINYSQSVAGYGINNSLGYDNIAIKNVKIYYGGSNLGYDHAIYAVGMTKSNITNVTILVPYGGVYLDSSTFNNISNSNITGTGGWDPISFNINSDSNVIINNNITMTAATTGYGIGLYTTSRSNNITNNKIESKTYGIYFSAASNNNNTISGNTILATGAAFDGIYVTSSDFNTILNNNLTTTANSASGVQFYSGSDSNNVTGNNITTYGQYGMGLLVNTTSNSNIISSNRILTLGTNWSHGVYVLKNSNSTTIINNNITTIGDNGRGISLFSVSYQNNISGNNITTSGSYSPGIRFYLNVGFNNISSNQIRVLYNNSYGIQLWSTVSNRVANNNITVSGDSVIGIRLEGGANSSTLLSNNITASGSSSWGIYFYSSSTSNTFSDNSITTSGSYGYGIRLDSSSTNTLSSNSITTSGTNGYGILLYSSSDSNNISDNTISTSNTTAYGVYIYSSSSNNITSGSIISAQSAAYSLRDASTTNNFTNTGFTALRNITFYDNTSWFNYRNDSSQNIWLKTNASKAGSINRTLINWSQSTMKWNDTNGTATLMMRYDLTGLLANNVYHVYNTSGGVQTNPYTLTTDSAGAVSFNISLNGNTEILVVVPPSPTYSQNSTNTTTAGADIRHNLRWDEATNGLSGYIFSWYNGANWTWSNLTADQESGTIQNKVASGDTNITTNINLTDLNFESVGVMTNWVCGLGCGTGDTWDEDSGIDCDGGAGSCAYADNWELPDRINYTVNLSSYTNCYLKWRYFKTLGLAPGEYIQFNIFNGSLVTKWNANESAAPTDQWANAPQTGQIIRDNVSWQGSQWLNLTRSNLSALTKLSFYVSDDLEEYIYIDNINLTCEKVTSSSNEANTSSTPYYDVLSGNVMEVIKNITVTVNVSYRNNSGSTANANNNPDLWLEIYDGSNWVGVGNFSVATTGNFSISTQNAAILAAWATPANRDVRIKGRYFDSASSVLYDEINYTAVWVKVDSTGEFMNDTWTAMTGTGNWSNVTKVVNSTIGATIKWNVYANSTVNIWTVSDVYSYLTTPPYILFVSPTGANNSYVNRNWTYINTTISDSSNATTFINWNNSLVGWWRFNREAGENDTLARDWSGYGNNGTIYNTNPGIDNCTGNCSGWTTSGKFGNAMQFDGVNDYVEIGNKPSHNITNSITIEAWINLSNSNNFGDIVDKLDGVNTGYRFYVGSNCLRMNLGNGTGSEFAQDCSMQPNKYFYVVGLWNGSVIQVYTNGVLIETVNMAKLATDTTSMQIGRAPWNGWFLNGTIDEVRIWNRALSPEEINASYNTGIYRLYHNFTNLADGTYNYTAYIQDLAGNVNQTETRTITIDTIQPAISVQSPTNITYNTTSIYFNITANEMLNWSGYSLDGSANVSLQNTTGKWWAQNLSMAAGAHIVKFYANDSAGNMNVSVATVYFTVTAVGFCQQLNTGNIKYNVTQNINSSATCITIGANNITLDGQGYTINYSKTATGYAINNTLGYNFTTIKNANILQGNSTPSGSYAIYFIGASNGTIQNNTITTLGTIGDGIYLSSSNYNNLSSNNITTSGSTGYGINLTSSSNNIISNNNITTSGVSSDGIDIFSSSNSNILYNNIIRTSNQWAGGFGIFSSSSNNITGGSFISQQYNVYYVSGASTTNNFTDTNFTASRGIEFADATSWFNYRNDSSQNIWLKTNASAAGSINRTLVNWNTIVMRWNETNGTSGLTARYNITGMAAGLTYYVYNTSNGVQTTSYTLTADANGNLPSFTIALNGNTEIAVGTPTMVSTTASNSNWTWKVPYSGDKIRLGSETNWQWTIFNNSGAGWTIPRGSAINWTWA